MLQLANNPIDQKHTDPSDEHIFLCLKDSKR
jgi:hypothetical protein